MIEHTTPEKRPFWTAPRLAFVFFLPLLSGVLGRLFKGRPVYNGLEFETLLCAGARGAEGITMYPGPKELTCEQYQTAENFL